MFTVHDETTARELADPTALALRDGCPVKSEGNVSLDRRNGKPVAPCGSFRVNKRTTTVRLSVPYDFSRFKGWVVTAQTARHHEPGRIVLHT